MEGTRQIISQIGGWLDRQPKLARIAAPALILALTAYADFRLPDEASLGIFYVIPPLMLAITGWTSFAIGAAIVAATAEQLLFTRHQSMAAAMWNAASNAALYAAPAIAVAAFRALQIAGLQSARHDYLTGLLNRRAFEEHAEAELSRGRRNNQPLTFLYLDCDNFRQINDAMSHERGDQLLQLIANSMRGNLRHTDLLARIGGDEFVALLPETGESQACAAASKLRESLARQLAKSGFKCTISAGVAVFAAPPESLTDAMRKAEHLLSIAKSEGKGTAKVDVFFGESTGSLRAPTDRAAYL